MSIKIIELGDKIELTRKSTFEKEEMYISKIQDFDKAQQRLTILAPLDGGKIIPLELNAEYYATVYTEMGLYRTEVAVVERSKDDNLYLIVLEVLTTLTKHQRRQYYRLDCILTFQYKDEVNDQWHEGLILDISGGGIRFTSHSILIKEKVITCHLQLNFEEFTKHLYLTGTIIESTDSAIEGKAVENRVRFENVSVEDREAIIRFIFEEERRRRKKEKGM